MLKSKIIANFKQKFQGEIITPEDATYESVKNVYSGQGSPTLIVQPKTADATVAAINFARENSLTLSVRGGGHHGAAFGTNTAGLVIDLSSLDSIELIDTQKHIVRIGGGAKWGDVASVLHQYGLALSSGDTTSVGVGGLTLSGGIGWMVRKWGLALDSLIGAEVVTASGNILYASETENTDLFWALRGGGGNFGVVTQFEFAAHSLNNVYFATIMYDDSDPAQLLKKWRDITADLSEDVSSSVTLLPAFTPSMSPSIMVLACFASDDEIAATRALEPLRHLGSKITENIEKKAYKDILQEAHPPQGMTTVIKNIFTTEFNNELIEKTVSIYKKGNWVFQARHIAGALNKVPAEATAFAHRESKFMMFAGAFMPITSSASDLIEAAKPWEDIIPFSVGAYANFISTRSREDVSAIYTQAAYSKLQKVKQKYDPENLFNQNYNISPKD